jgi:hypothetical protein
MNVRFSDFIAEAVDGTQVTNEHAVSMPLAGDTRDTQLEVFVSGYAFAEAGADVRLRIRVNDVTKSYVMRPKAAEPLDREYVHVVRIPRVNATTCTITVTLDAGADAGASAYLNVAAIDANIQ